MTTNHRCNTCGKVSTSEDCSGQLERDVLFGRQICFEFCMRCIAPLFSPHTEKSFRNLIISNRNQSGFTIFRLIWNQTDTIRLLFWVYGKMINTIWFRFDLIRSRNDFSVCGPNTFGKTTTIRRTAVRVTGVSQQSCLHDYRSLSGPSYCGSFRGGLN